MWSNCLSTFAKRFCRAQPSTKLFARSEFRFVFAPSYRMNVQDELTQVLGAHAAASPDEKVETKATKVRGKEQPADADKVRTSS